MIYVLHRPNRHYRRLSKVIGYIAPVLRLTSRVIPVVMNAELAEMQARRRARLNAEMYSNRPDHDWIGETSPDFLNEVAHV